MVSVSIIPHTNQTIIMRIYPNRDMLDIPIVCPNPGPKHMIGTIVCKHGDVCNLQSLIAFLCCSFRVFSNSFDMRIHRNIVDMARLSPPSTLTKSQPQPVRPCTVAVLSEYL
jgi:hypothetical protein